MKQRSSLTVFALAALGLFVLARARKVSTDRTNNPPNNPIAPGTPSSVCAYPKAGLPPPFSLSQAELSRRIYSRITETRSDWFGYGVYIANGLARAKENNIPAELITAVCFKESTFSDELDDLAKRIAQNQPIGPLQVRPIAFTDVGMNVNLLLGQTREQRVNNSILAGMLYLNKIKRDYLPGKSWCEALHAYNVGIGDYKKGKRNQAYVNAIIEKANQWTELRG